VLNVSFLPASGSINVKPVETITQYTLTAYSRTGSVSKTLQVQLAPPGGGGGGQVFYFKMTTSGSGVLPPVTPCFTVAVYAPDGKAQTAKAIAEQENGSYEATQIDASQFTTACG
jgi:hypothetical protein